MKKRELRIVQIDGMKVVKAIDVTGKLDREIGKIERGMNINLDHNRFIVEDWTEEQP